MSSEALVPASELAIEESMARLGQERYWSLVQAARRRGRRTETPAGRHLMKQAVDAVEGGVREWMKMAHGGPAPAGHAIAYLADFDPAVLAFISVRAVLDMAGHEIALTAAAHAVASALEEEAHFMELKNAEPVMWRDLRKRMKRASSQRGRSAMLASAGAKASLRFAGWPRRDKIRLGVTMIELVRMHTGLIEIRQIGAAGARMRLVVSATEETLKWLEDSDQAHAAMFPFHLPTLVPPLDWKAPRGGGYHSDAIVRRPFIKTRDHGVLLEAAGSREIEQVYRAANALQRTAWRVNPRVHAAMMEFWNAGTPVAGLPERVDEVPLVRPEVPKESPEYQVYRKAAFDRHKRVVAARSHRVLAAKTVFVADTLQSEKAFYFPYQADFRGRVYPVPFFLQPQGPSIARGLLEFAHGKPIRDQEQARWFLIHGANTFGVDKVSFAQRSLWTREHHAEILASAESPSNFRWWAEADKPWEFLAWAFEYAEWVRRPAQFVSRIPVAMDGSNNGLQIFSLLMRDPVAAEATNVLPTEVPRDVYQAVADSVVAELIRLSVEGKPEEKLASARWLEFTGARLPRAATKRQVMTLPYGSTFHACIHYTRDWYELEVKARGGVAPFERGYDPAVFLARLIWAAIGATVGSARACMDWLRSIADQAAGENKRVRWVSPSGFPVHQPYNRYKSRRIRTAVGDFVRWSRVREDTNTIDRKRQLNGISPNFVHSLDAAALVKAVNRATARGVKSFATVHDSYGVLAADAPMMARTLREVYVEMFSGDLLEDFRSQMQAQLEGPVPVPPERGDLDVNSVLKSEYFFA